MALLALQERWQDRVRKGEPARGGSRRTYHLMQILQPAPEVEPEVATSEALDTESRA